MVWLNVTVNGVCDQQTVAKRGWRKVCEVASTATVAVSRSLFATQNKFSYDKGYTPCERHRLDLTSLIRLWSYYCLI